VKVPNVPACLSEVEGYDRAVNIRVATPADAAVVRSWRAAPFTTPSPRPTTRPTWRFYLAGAYSIDIQTRELSDRDITTLLVEEGGRQSPTRCCARLTFPNA
jgi:hypothetical protein